MRRFGRNRTGVHPTSQLPEHGSGKTEEFSADHASVVAVPAPRNVRRIAAQLFVSMDGVMQGPGGPDEDRDGGFPHGGWSMNYGDESTGRSIVEFYSQPHELLLGRRTYEIFARYWPHHGDNPIGAIINRDVKHVASRTLRKLDWENSRLLGGEAETAVRRLKSKPGSNLHVIGSSNLLQTLLRADLVDDLFLWTSPVVLGTGKRLFGEGVPPTAWSLARSSTNPLGLRMDFYTRSGQVTYGSPPD